MTRWNLKATWLGAAGENVRPSCHTICVVGLLYLQAATLTPRGWAQEQFELSAPHLGVNSRATLSGTSLQVVGADGVVTNYVRDARFDSQDRAWLGFFSRTASQVLRWPAAGSGNMQIGSMQGNSIAYRTSQMTIRPIAPADRVARRPVLPPVMEPPALEPAGQLSTVGGLVAELALSKLFEAVSNRSRRADAELLRLASYDARGVPWVLTRGSGFNLNTIRSGTTVGADWWVTPAGPGYVRIESYDQGLVYAVSAVRGGGLALQPLSQDPGQLWRVTGVGRVAHRFVLESVAFPGNCFARQAGGVFLQPITYQPAQLWSPFVAPVVPTFRPFWRSVNTEIIAAAPLPPAKIELQNSHRFALLVLLGDVRTGAEFEQIRIEPGTSTTVMLDRDPGATLLETVEIRSLGGLWERQQYSTAVPPSALYDLSVYEEHLQSIAIDATGKSPNPIEDVNYVPKSVGWLALPADLPAQGRIDVYARAKAANNPGAVRRLDPAQFEEQPDTSPVEALLEKFQSTPRRKF